MEFLLQILLQLAVVNYQLVTLSLVIYDYLQFLPCFLLARAVVGPDIGPLIVRFNELRGPKFGIRAIFSKLMLKWFYCQLLK
jgi:hypothetical protein